MNSRLSVPAEELTGTFALSIVFNVSNVSADFLKVLNVGHIPIDRDYSKT